MIVKELADLSEQVYKKFQFIGATRVKNSQLRKQARLVPLLVFEIEQCEVSFIKLQKQVRERAYVCVCERECVGERKKREIRGRECVCV